MTAIADISANAPLNDSFLDGHVQSILESIGSCGPVECAVLVGHSGAGAILPALRHRLRCRSRMIFCDADTPHDGKSRLDMLPDGVAAEFRAAATGGMLPPLWNGQDLKDEIDDPAVRAELVSALRSVPLSVYEEKIPVPSGSLDGVHGFILFTEHYRPSLERAMKLGWRTREMNGRHFDPLNKAAHVTAALKRMAEEAGPGAR